MPALDFPTNPTNGQSYSGYTYNSTTGAWLANSAAVSPVTMSDSVPPNPTSGDMWFNTSDATMYLYYNDGSSSQWVESRAPITSDGYYSPNYIINGGFDIWQRGTGTFSSGYAADRWLVGTSLGGATSVTRSTDTPDSTVQYSLESTISSVNFNTIGQRIESAHVGVLGSTVTLSFWARSLSGTQPFTVEMQAATAKDNFAGITSFAAWSSSGVPSSSWAFYSATFTLNATALANGLQVIIYRNNSSTSGYRITKVQLESGTVATPFRRNANSIQGELAACQRYYWRSTPGTLYGVHPSTGVGINTTRSYQGVTHPVPMRITPTSVDWYNVGIHTPGVETFGLTSATIVPSDSDNYVTTIDCYVSSGLTFRNVYRLSNNNNTSGYIGFNAEL